MKRTRVGSLLLELSMALAIVTVALVSAAQLLAFAGRQQQVLQFKRIANIEAANVMERLMARPFDQLTEDPLNDVALSEEAQTLLPNAELAIDVVASDEPPASRQITIEIEWQGGGAQREQVRLVAWKYADQD